MALSDFLESFTFEHQTPGALRFYESKAATTFSSNSHTESWVDFFTSLDRPTFDKQYDQDFYEQPDQLNVDKTVSPLHLGAEIASPIFRIKTETELLNSFKVSWPSIGCGFPEKNSFD